MTVFGDVCGVIKIDKIMTPHLPVYGQSHQKNKQVDPQIAMNENKGISGELFSQHGLPLKE
jgi:hypothetical protein